MNSYVKFWTNYVNFNGRTSRKDYWITVLINFVISLVLSAICGAIENNILAILFSLATLVPGLALSIRRMHDIGKSGFWILVSLIPLAGVIWFIVLAATAGVPGENEYGMLEE